MRRHLFLALSFAIVFFVASFYTLGDYNASWDETIHWRRGQAYLRYFLTGKTNYDDLDKNDLRSFYQSDNHNAEYFLKKDVGHPPINDELAAASNYIFFQKLGVISDISAYHLFNIASASLLVFVVTFFVASTFGIFPATVSFLALSTYPLFWAESHFNIKDPAEAAFFAATIWAFYESLNRKSALWLALSYLFFTLALGTKFNAVFIPVILIPYLLYRYRQRLGLGLKKTLLSIPRNYLLVLLLGPLAVFVVFISAWPFLTQNFPENLIKIINFYKGIGLGLKYQPDKFFIFGFNTYPILAIIYTTPPLVLFLSGVGAVSAWINRNKYKNVAILWLLWLIVPVVRVTLPGTVIYGGIRQILEFLPAMAVLSGLGAGQIVVWTRRLPATFVKLALVLAFAWPVFVLFKMHPNQNVYFNSLIGGLPQARQRNFPSWGNSFGNAYLQGIDWINEYVEKGAKLALIQGTPSNAPPILLRSDINYLVEGNVDSQETYFSGIERGGEYLMELTFNDTGRDFFYAWEYVDKFLIPVYEVKVEGVAIAKIWKNDLDHTKPEFRLKEEVFRQDLKVAVVDNKVLIDLDNQVFLSKVVLESTGISGCSLSGNVDTSLDGESWIREKDAFPQLQIRRRSNVEDNRLTYYFAGRRARHVRLWLDSHNLCRVDEPQIRVFVLK